MNPDEGREVASEISELGSLITELIDAPTTVLGGIEWVGPDYDAFLEEWNSFVSNQINGIVEALTARSEALNQHSEQQDTTSNQG
ncbi:MAG TPA: hypothetical protein H9837_10365 [Candidatus Brachybacterium merdigallinarum]|nr:hypothetical protein [Candidatus Brachybacterium merdigallinarum]